jgi:anti-sigma B factor antagonist
MRLKEANHNGIDVFALEGDIDLHFAPCFRSVLQAKINAHCPALIVDLTQVTFIDSTGLSVIIEYFRDAAQHRGVLCLCGLNDELKNIFRIVGLDRTISMFATVNEATSAISAGSVQPHTEAAFARAEKV